MPPSARIDRLGPELSLREIAEEAGTAKPKIYRHFTDKSDLFQAIGERLRDMLWAAIFPSINVATDPAREVDPPQRRAVCAPGRRAPERGAVPYAGPLRRTERVRDARHSTRVAASRSQWQTCSTTSYARWNSTGAAIELAAFATFGTAASATDWWLGADHDSPRRMPPDEFVAHLTTIMVGVINGTCELLGIKIDPDLPLHDGVRRRRIRGLTTDASDANDVCVDGLAIPAQIEFTPRRFRHQGVGDPGCDE